MTNPSAVLRLLQQQRNQAARNLARIDAAIAALTNRAGRPTVRRRPRLSAAARGRIAAAQKARWANWRKAKKG